MDEQLPEVTLQDDASALAATDPRDQVADQATASLPKRGLLGQAARALIAPIIAVLAWVIPGLGHLLLRRWQRSAVFFVAVGGLAVTGYVMRGNVFRPHSQDPFGTLGFLADASSGVFYLLAHAFEKAGPDVARALGDYGTRFIAGAGVVNLLGVCDAYEVARGRRP
jgi:hypothetical protein